MNLKAIKDLQQNASKFFNNILSKFANELQCSRGCSQCCHTQISVFECEARVIEEFFHNLSLDQKNTLVTQWQSWNKAVNACSFLINDECSVYSARPIICRTQGAPLYFKAKDNNIKDVCPLNFKQSFDSLSLDDFIHLDRLNTLLSIAQQQFELVNSDTLTTIENSSEDRISLSRLRRNLIDEHLKSIEN